jgi:hypothetical protein
MLYKLKTVTVDGVFILISGNVMDDNGLGDVRAKISVWLADALVLDSRFLLYSTDRELTRRKKELVEFHHRDLCNSTAP